MNERIDLTVPEFVRTIWVSEEARSVWEPRISVVSQMFQRVEVHAVREGIKPAALQASTPQELAGLADETLDLGLDVAPLERCGSSGSYSNAAIPFEDGKPWAYRLAIARHGVLRQFLKAWKAKDDRAIGSLLGFPDCCVEFFQTYWVNGGFRDTTYPMVIELGDKTHYEVNGPIECNILLRWLGVRAVSHLPCSFNCSATERMGKMLLELAGRLFPQETSWLREMLDWPIRWNSLHGIVTITTPVMRIVTSTDAFAEKIIIDRKGTSYPKEGASGLEFPFMRSSPIQLLKRNAFLWRDNGFDSIADMDKAHVILLETLTRLEVPAITKVLDLGCGNGVLLEKIGKMFPADLHGIEIDLARWERAKERMDASRIVIVHGDLTDEAQWNPPYGLILISVNRFIEMNKEDRKELFARIARDTDYLLIYTYDGENLDAWAEEYFRFKFITRKTSRDGNIVAYLLRSMHVDSFA